MRPEELTRIDQYTDRIVERMQKKKPNYHFTPALINRILKLYQEALRLDLIRNKKNKPDELFLFPKPTTLNYYLQAKGRQHHIYLIVGKPSHSHVYKP